VAWDPDLDRDLARILDIWVSDGSPDTIFVANRRNDITWTNAPLVYWALDARPASWVTSFEPGLADQVRIQEEIIGDLCENRAPVVLMETFVPRRSKTPPPSTALDRFLALNYDLLSETPRFDYRVFAESDCVFSANLRTPAEVELRLDDRLLRGDEVAAAVLADWHLELGGSLLRVITDPPVPGTIFVDGTPADDTGVWTDLEPGDHQVCFGEVTGFGTPDCQTAVITAGQSVQVTGSYTERGFLRVITDPPVPGTIFVDGTPVEAWGTWVDLEPGDHQVCFGEVTGFGTPDCQTAVITAGQSVQVTGSYTPTNS
jgi:hypothetical protein